jgi:hypothetical protein
MRRRGTGRAPAPAAALPAWLQGAAVNEWVSISGTTHAGSAADLTSDGRSTSRLAYSGAALKDAELIIPAAGGHGDYSGNEVSSLDLSQNAPAWALRIARSGSVQSDVAYYADGKPSSRHLYWSTHYSTTRSRVMLHRSRFVYGSAVSFDDSNGFNLANNTWDADGTWADGKTSGCRDSSDNVWAHDDNQRDIWKWTASTDTWARTLDSGSGTWPGYPWAYNSDGDYLFGLSIGDGEAGGSGVRAAKMTSGGTARTAITFNSSAGLTQFEADADEHAGMDYVPATGKFYWYAGLTSTGRVYEITPNGGTTWDVAILSTSGATVPAVEGNGIFNRWRYVPTLQGFVCMASGSANVCFLRVQH